MLWAAAAVAALHAASAQLTIEPLPPELAPDFSTWFSKYVGVFGVIVLGAPDTPDADILHAAGVLAQYLDNDEDGSPDNPLVVEMMRNPSPDVDPNSPGEAVLLMFPGADSGAQNVLANVLAGGNSGWG